MTAHPQRDEAQEKRDGEGDDEPDGQREPRRRAIARRQIRSRVGTEPHKRGLPERRLARDSGEQHQAQRDDAVQADVIAERHPEWRHRQRHEREQHQDRGKCGGPHAHARERLHSSSSW